MANNSLWHRHGLTRRDWTLAIVLAAAAILARWSFISHGRTILHSDEAIVGLMADDIAHGRQFPLYFYGQRYMGAMEAYVIAGLQLLTGQPLISLRLGPAIFFALLVAAQFLMLTRWFGRVGGLIGAAALLCAPPWIMQWTVVARGGYVEIMLWGTLLWWAYGEWFTGPSLPTVWQKALLGFLIGSGLWLNPTIVAFLAPIVAHALMGQPLARLRASARGRSYFAMLDQRLPRWPIAMPLLVASIVPLISAICYVQISETGVEYRFLLGALPHSAAVVVILLGAVGVAAWLLRTTNLLSWVRSRLETAAPLILGTLVGLTPAIAYVAHRSLTQQPLEDCLPLGFRAPWTVDETARYLLCGLPLLLGADPQPMVQMIQTGRWHALHPISPFMRHLLFAGGCLTLGMTLFLGYLFVRDHHREFWMLMRLRSRVYSPSAFLLLAVLGLASLYLLSGCSLDFTSVRYLAPVWAAVPGVLASLLVSRRLQSLKRIGLASVLAAWTIGQLGLLLQLGAPHPLQEVAAALRARQIRQASAETLDAHLLSYLTGQDCRVLEFQPFWQRLGHYGAAAEGANQYLVRRKSYRWRWPWPGPPPVDTHENLAPTLRAWVHQHPDALLRREVLTDDYELWTLREAVPDNFSADLPAVAAN